MILTADRVVTGDGKTVLENGAIFVENGKIGDVGPVAALRGKYAGAEVREYQGASILPGLIDMHVHNGYYQSRHDAAEYNDFKIAFLAQDYCKRAFAKGVTTMRDVSSHKNLCASINYAVKQGFIEAPRLISTDSAISMTGGHGSGASGSNVEVDGPWAIRAAIRDNIKRGAQWIKIMASHRTNTPEFTQEELDAAVHEAHRVGKKLAVHAGTQPSIQMCIDAGFDTIEHGTHMTLAQARQMKENGQVWCPTIAAYTRTYEYILESLNKTDIDAVGADFVEHHDYFRDAAMAYRDNFYTLYKTGIKIVCGTDVIFQDAPATPMDWEMRYMADYGMPVLEIIQAATKNGAETLDIGHLTGDISAGKAADILVVQGDVVADIGCVANVAEVFFGGKSVYRAS